jgi:hypothetical protein
MGGKENEVPHPPTFYLPPLCNCFSVFQLFNTKRVLDPRVLTKNTVIFSVKYAKNSLKNIKNVNINIPLGSWGLQHPSSGYQWSLQTGLPLHGDSTAGQSHCRGTYQQVRARHRDSNNRSESLQGAYQQARVRHGGSTLQARVMTWRLQQQVRVMTWRLKQQVRVMTWRIKQQVRVGVIAERLSSRSNS